MNCAMNAAPYFDGAKDICKFVCPPTGYCKSNTPYVADSTTAGSTTTAPVDTCWESKDEGSCSADASSCHWEKINTCVYPVGDALKVPETM